MLSPPHPNPLTYVSVAQSAVNPLVPLDFMSLLIEIEFDCFDTSSDSHLLLTDWKHSNVVVPPSLLADIAGLLAFTSAARTITGNTVS